MGMLNGWSEVEEDEDAFAATEMSIFCSGN